MVWPFGVIGNTIMHRLFSFAAGMSSSWHWFQATKKKLKRKKKTNFLANCSQAAEWSGMNPFEDWTSSDFSTKQSLETQERIHEGKSHIIPNYKGGFLVAIR